MRTGGIHTGMVEDDRTIFINSGIVAASSSVQNSVSPSEHRNVPIRAAVPLAEKVSKSNGRTWSGRPVCS